MSLPTGKHGRWMLLAVSMLCCLLLAELALRVAGYRPGQHQRAPYFEKVNPLWMKKGFTTDSAGIFRISDEAMASVWQMMGRDSFLQMPDQCAEAYCNAEDALRLRRGLTPGELSSAYQAAKARPQAQRTDWQQSVVALVDSSVNPDGFRSIPFRKAYNKKPSVLLLGDSFTYGFSASSLHLSFADLLLARGYTVYNSGITGTDVAQYLAVARHWVPRLQPDIVIVNMYLGNDVTWHRREVCAGCPVFFPTNAGNLMACPEGVRLHSAQEAYHRTLQWFYIPEAAGRLGRWMSFSALTSVVWGVLWSNGAVSYYDPVSERYYQGVADARLAAPYCRTELSEIDSVARAHGARCVISAIPEVYRRVSRTAEDFPEVFEGMGYVQMAVTRDDYNLSDGHFNDRGHRRYADFLQRIIDGHE